jgi:hypothetical protein
MDVAARGGSKGKSSIRGGTKKEAAQLTPDCAASNLKAEGWCLSVFESEYSPSRKNVPNHEKNFGRMTPAEIME